MSAGTKPIVFFIHGLNTFGDDRFHVGPLVFRPMWNFWKPKIEDAGFEFISLDEMGFGAFEDQVGRALAKIERTLSVRPSPITIHLFGHSMGGLVVRGVAARLLESSRFASESARLGSVISLGTPHQGTRATEDALDLSKRAPAFYRALKLFGYDLAKRREPLQYFTIERVREFAARHPRLEKIRCVSFVGAATRRQLGLPFHPIYRHLHESSEPSDGLISAESQRWAEDGGTFALDHFAQLGVFLQLLPGERRAAQREFERLVESFVQVIRSTSP